MFEKKEKKSMGIPCLTGVVVILFVINMLFNYFVVTPKVAHDYLTTEYNMYGGKDNYEKMSILQKANIIAQLETQFKGMSTEDIQKKIDAELSQLTGGTVAQGTEGEQPAVDQQVDMKELTLNTPVYGSTEAPFSILEFSDLECPACQGFHQSGIVKNFVDANGQTVNYIYKNFQFHQGAPMKGEIGLCVAELGGTEAFYNYIDAHFTSDNLRASKDDMIARVVASGIDKTQLTACVDAGTKKEALASDKAQGDIFGVTGTPTVVIINNATGKWSKLENRSAEGIQTAIDSVK